MQQLVLALVVAGVGAGCGSGAVNSAEDAKKAYLGLDASIDKAITLGFAGFNGAKSANIDPQTASGASTGMMTVTGQVDQGASNNKTMRLLVELKNYSDEGKLTYDSIAGSLPMLNMDLKMIPSGTLSGSWNGKVTMSGAQKGEVVLALTFTGQLQPDPNDATKVQRKPGTTHITGTATSPGGTYMVDVTR